MDDNSSSQQAAQVTQAAPPPIPILCPQCHQPVASTAYYCPNCGKKLSDPPLSISVGSQAWIYAFSIILPWIAYLAISYWPGIKYLRSDDPEAKQVGMVAMALLVISSVIAFWLSIVWIQNAVQSSVNSVGNIGGF